MKSFTFFSACIILFISVGSFSVRATVPPSGTVRPASIYDMSAKQIANRYGIKMSWKQKLLWPLQRHMLKRNDHGLTKEQRSAQTGGLIAGIAGVLGLVFLFIIPGLGLALACVGIIAGIVSLNNNPKPAFSKIGIIAGALAILFAIVALFAVIALL
jgi:hypothetical protein